MDKGLDSSGARNDTANLLCGELAADDDALSVSLANSAPSAEVMDICVDACTGRPGATGGTV